MPLRFQPAIGASVLLSSSSRGPAGAAATIAVGSTTTGAQGTSASVSNSGSSSAATFNFTIPRGAVPSVGWNFDSATADADPGAGDFRLNHATPASATAAYFDNAERGGTTVTSYLDTWDDTGDATTRGHLVLTSAATPTTFHIYHVSGSIVDGTGYRKVTISTQGGSGTFTEGEHVAVMFLPAGPAATANSFETITTPSGTSPVADSSTDTLTLAAPAAGMTITGNSGTDTITFALANDLAALEALSGTGHVVHTGSETYAERTITGTANQITVTNGSGVSGNPTLSLPADVLIPTVLTVPNTGLHILDTNASHDLIIAPGSDLTGDHTLTVTTGDADRTLTISGNATISQDYSATGSPTFAAPTVTTLELGAASTDTTLARASAGIVTVEGTPLLKAGKQTIWIPAAAMWARTTNGAAASSRELTTSGDIMIKAWAFDTTTEEAVQFYIAFPKSWDKSTVTFQAFWTNVNGLTTETVSWGLSAGAYTDSDAMDSTELGTEVRVSDTWLAANDIHVSAESGAVTVGNTPVDDDMVIGQIARSVANDNMTGDAELLGIKIFFTTNAATDA